MGLVVSPLVGLQPWLRPYVDYALDAFEQWSGVRPIVTSVYRSVEDQQRLYENRATNPYPVNRPGDSAHQYGLAFDSSFPKDRKAELMPYWVWLRRQIGFTVPENDEVHAEYPNWRSLLR